MSNTFALVEKLVAEKGLKVDSSWGNPPARSRRRYNRVTDMTMFFNPFHGDDSSQLIVDKISKATERVFVAMYTFTYKKIARELISAKKRGVDVRVILDRENMKKMNQPVYSLLIGEDMSCGFRTQKGLLHHKIVLIDSLLVAGSCNFTGAAFSSNDETMLILDPVPQKFQCQIQSWWESVERQSSLHRGK